MILPDLQTSIGIYNIRLYEEHAYRTTLYVAKNKLLVLEMRNNIFTLEVVDNAQNLWHSIEEYEYTSEKEIFDAVHQYLLVKCGHTKSHKINSKLAA